MEKIVCLISGLVFGLGLVISGMANPAKVIGFLSITARWDPSLAFVMGGAIIIGVIAFFIAKRKTTSLLGLPISLPTNTSIDKKLVVGAILFGLGWGLAGICPGPGLVLFAMGIPKGIAFVGAMLVGMILFELTVNKISKQF
ncbi:DUF6691 family protein [Thorsellia anophelis]|uniref:Sulphur transport domain-containing protein n=1 Tax=Thorsellia anophelis DSM 18579 TaxID=1123402 RepID=A0A1I0E9D4_9GAMM|nr:DUF6691 family protein [Thorsellia anophelis]SET41807.1 hypothetical protein SAMN02583745_02301 [Thorsellia anophelis DSM 18579]